MREIKQYQAEDGSIWGSEAAAQNHEKYLRGETAVKPDVGYLVVDLDYQVRCYKKVGGTVSRLDTKGCSEASDAYEAILKDIGYYVPLIMVDPDEEDEDDFWPKDDLFEKYGHMIERSSSV